MNGDPISITVDTRNFYADQVGPQGVTTSELAALAVPLRTAASRVASLGSGGLDAEYACLNLGAEMVALIPAIQKLAQNMQRLRHLVLIGIGGSSLGTKAILEAVAKRSNVHSDLELHFVENVDPYSLRQVLNKLESRNTGLLCISKSGGTIETVVQYLVLRNWLTEELGPNDARRRQWIVTDPQNGWLREIAENDGIESLPVPPRVGGRYSVLSPVGLLPLAASGIDIGQLLAGAQHNATRCSGTELQSNPALEIAALCYLLDKNHDKRIAVMMPYVNRLRLFVDWYCQLWAESLGKWDRTQPGSEPAGTLPVRAMGAVDQHSQLQMYLESRHDKFFTFIELANWEYDLPIPLSQSDRGHFPYLSDMTMTDVIDAEFRATRQVITDAGHPNMTLRLPALNAHVLGQLIDLYQRVTIYTGLLYGINPLDQPSVEKGKRLAVDYLRSAPRRS